MSVELSPKTFDLVGMLAGRDYPTETIDVYFNESLGFSIKKMRDMVRELDRSGKEEESAQVQAKLDELVKSTEDNKFVIHLEGIPEKVYRAIVKKVNEKFPIEEDMLGRKKENPLGDEELTFELWSAYLRKVVTPSGEESLIDTKEVQALIDEAPPTVQVQINQAIHELRRASEEGFEYAAKEVGFLSLASPEG